MQKKMNKKDFILINGLQQKYQKKRRRNNYENRLNMRKNDSNDMIRRFDVSSWPRDCIKIASSGH